MSLLLRVAGRVLREVGLGFDRAGTLLQRNGLYHEQLSRHRRLMPVGTARPALSQDVWVAPNASVVGDVALGKGASVWYGAVVRGDVNTVRIGALTSIGDRAVVHCSGDRAAKGPSATVIGDKVTVGAGAVLHGCTVQDEAFIDVGASVLDGAVVEKHAKVAAGSLVPSNKRIPTGQLWGGNPAQFLRNLTSEEIAAIRDEPQRIFELSVKHDEAYHTIDTVLERGEPESNELLMHVVDKQKAGWNEVSSKY